MSIPPAPVSSTAELEAVLRLAAARDLLDHVLVGDVVFQPWTAGARGLIERAEFLMAVAI